MLQTERRALALVSQRILLLESLSLHVGNSEYASPPPPASPRLSRLGSDRSASDGLASLDVCKRHQKSQSPGRYACIPARGRRGRASRCLYGKSLRSLLGLQLKCDTQRLVPRRGFCSERRDDSIPITLIRAMASPFFLPRSVLLRCRARTRILLTIWNSSSKGSEECVERSRAPFLLSSSHY
ncbi:hypothetical protein B0J13DRAFT_137366 [Dactylonectria estremocensis]|uniref:Uncharacterized protein n=1 Tax=Dactylonectria estremocensis TaxID=1079267 RepID=A0A9P9E273_9HYPO|nr:hypothetical protein B0J13DRAFT_137366 [Dactylonectria estremocensis]